MDAKQSPSKIQLDNLHRGRRRGRERVDRRSGGWWRTRSDTQPLGPREKEKEDRRGGVIEIGGEMDGKGEKEGKKMEIHAPRSPDW